MVYIALVSGCAWSVFTTWSHGRRSGKPLPGLGPSFHSGIILFVWISRLLTVGVFGCLHIGLVHRSTVIFSNDIYESMTWSSSVFREVNILASSVVRWWCYCSYAWGLFLIMYTSLLTSHVFSFCICQLLISLIFFCRYSFSHPCCGLAVWARPPW